MGTVGSVPITGNQANPPEMGKCPDLTGKSKFPQKSAAGLPHVERPMSLVYN